ncbi:MAG: hypothetical protein K6L60_14880 [Oceanobacter sp.]
MSILMALIVTVVFCFIVYTTYILIKIVDADSKDIERVRYLSGGVKNVIFGTVDAKPGSVRDHNIHAGLVFDRKTKELKLQGTISDEAIEAIIK